MNRQELEALLTLQGWMPYVIEGYCVGIRCDKCLIFTHIQPEDEFVKVYGVGPEHIGKVSPWKPKGSWLAIQDSQLFDFWDYACEHSNKLGI